MATIHYCKGWFRGKKRALQALPVEDARALHSQGEKYCAIIGSVENPICFLEITGTVIGVGFLDRLLRESLSYSFQKKDFGKLFLSMAVWREFEGESDKIFRGTTYIFDPTGRVSIRREKLSPEYVLEQSEFSADVTTNWNEFPAFGECSSLIKIERLHEYGQRQ